MEEETAGTVTRTMTTRTITLKYILTIGTSIKSGVQRTAGTERRMVLHIGETVHGSPFELTSG